MKDRIALKFLIATFMIICCGTLAIQAQTPTPILDSAGGVYWSPDGSILAISGRGRKWFYYPSSGDLEYLTADFAFQRWTADGRIYTGSGFYNPITRRIENQFTLQLPQGRFSTGVGLSHDTKSYATLEGDYLDTIVIYSTETGAPIRRIETHNLNAGPQIEWSPDDSQFAMLVPNRPSVLIIPNVDNPTIIEHSITSSPAYQTAMFPGRLKWSPDGHLLAIAVWSSSVFLLDVQSGTFIGALEGQAAAVMSWSPDGKRLAAANMDGTITVWDVETGQSIAQYQTFGYLYDLEFNPFGGTLAVANEITQALQYKYIVTPVPQKLSIDDKSLYVQSIGEMGAVQLFVPAPSSEQLISIVQMCGLQNDVEHGLVSQIAVGELQAFKSQISRLMDTQIQSGCKAELLAVASALLLEGL